MNAGDIGIGRFESIGIFSAAISGTLSGSTNPSIKNLRAAIAIIDGILGFENQFFGQDADMRRANLELFKGYRSAAAGAMSVKKRQRHEFLRQSIAHLFKVVMSKHDRLMKADMEKLDKNERAAMQSAIDSVVGKKEKPKLRVIR